MINVKKVVKESIVYLSLEEKTEYDYNKEEMVKKHTVDVKFMGGNSVYEDFKTKEEAEAFLANFE